MNFSDVFIERKNDYLNDYNLYLALFNKIPNVSTKKNIDCRMANAWFIENYKSEIKDVYFDHCYFKDSKKMEIDNHFYILYDDLLVYINIHSGIIKFLFRKTDFTLIAKLESELFKFKIKNPKDKPYIYLLIQSIHGLETKRMEVSRPKLKLEDNYNEDFKQIHKTIINRLSKKDDKGLVLLYGRPGTGKTSYIRYLITTLKKKVIFLNPQMGEMLTSPFFMDLLIDNSNSVFVIEDAENIIVDRNNMSNSPVSALLNITDGLLSDCLHIQFICSFNTDISKVDSALLRKGRLIAQYEFKELEVEKAQSLSHKLGFNTKIQKPMTLTEIYNQDDMSFNSISNHKPVGFYNR